MTQVPWRRSIKQHRGEAIASLMIRLAPKGLLTPFEFLKYHFRRDGRLSPTDIATDLEALRTLAFIGSFDVELLYAATWKVVGTMTEFLGRRLPAGWFKPGVRRLAPGVMRSDDDPWIRNDWQIRGLPCDCDTGELIAERCANCYEALTWTRIHDVYSCGTCGYDQRLAKSRYVAPDTLVRSRALRDYLQGAGTDLPTELAALEDHEFLSLICWLPYFVAIPDRVRVRPSPHEAVTGFGLIKQWPRCFEATLDALLLGYSPPYLVKHAVNPQVLEEALVALGRVGSKPAQAILEARMLTRLGLSGLGDSRFVKPVAKFNRRRTFARAATIW
ncbi:MAG: hypothetical protein QOI93_5755 [Rhodospirillaceae bacterium]|nr:hypothetical protein [Rhodospirillaceae bacterium]